MKKILYILFLLPLFAGCHQGSMSEKLNEIDSLVAKEQYDSAAMLLGDVAKVSLTDEDQAHYNLLATQLGYLTQKPLPSDSLLDLAIAYYKKAGNHEKLADAYYYKAYDNIMRNKISDATYYYKVAEEHAEHSANPNQQYKIYESLSATNELTGNHLLQLNYAQKALSKARIIGNKEYEAYAYFYVSSAYSELGHKDSAISCLKRTIPLINYIKKEDRPTFLTNAAYTLKHTSPDSAKLYLKESLAQEESSVTMEHLADIYWSEGNQEEAYRLWMKALSIDDGVSKDIIYQNIFEYDMQHGQTNHIRETVNEIIHIKDSMLNKLKNDTIKDLQLRFDHEVAMHQQEQKANNWQKGALIAIIVVILLVAYIVIRRMSEKSKLQEAQMLINDYTTQIRELEKSKTEAGETINELQNKIKEQLENLSPQLLRGQMLYEQIKRGELTTIHKWSRSDEKLFVDYYKVMDYRTVNKLSSVKRADKLTDHNLFYLLLKEMGKTDPEIQELFGISNNAIRVIKSKTKEIT